MRSSASGGGPVPRRKVLPAALLAWIEAQPRGSIMRRDTFAGIETRAFNKLTSQGVAEKDARARARAVAGAAYWRAAVRKYTISMIGEAAGAKGQRKQERKERRRRKATKNPVLAIMGNPALRVFSEDVHAILYTHADDGKSYRHDFRGGVNMAALSDGSVLIYHPAGLPVWREF